jgi:oligopeptide/dipeptide ABC transporter ATP-binding protein
MTTPIIDIAGVSKRFVRRLDMAERIARRLGAGIEERTVHAVEDVSLTVAPGEVLGLVGESGCGKSTLGRMVAGLMTPSEGAIRFRGRDVAGLKGRDAREAALKVQMIFQDPMSSLNPRQRVDAIVGEAPEVHGIVTRRSRDSYVADMLSYVGLDPEMRRRYPHQFSGGQRQRIGIARALAVRPDFLVCDESVAALDVSIQAQVLNLFMRLREAFDLTYLFISHDLGVVEHISGRVAIMYLGRIVEEGPTEAIFAAANHPYTQALLAERPVIAPGKRVFSTIKGEIPSPLKPPPGCYFHPRCPHAFERCKVERPALKVIAPGRRSACHLNDAVA